MSAASLSSEITSHIITTPFLSHSVKFTVYSRTHLNGWESCKGACEVTPGERTLLVQLRYTLGKKIITGEKKVLGFLQIAQTGLLWLSCKCWVQIAELYWGICCPTRVHWYHIHHNWSRGADLMILFAQKKKKLKVFQAELQSEFTIYVVSVLCLYSFLVHYAHVHC